MKQVSATADEPARRDHGKRAANKGGRSVWQTCDRTKLTTLATFDVFELQRVVESFKAANFNLSHLHLAPPLGVNWPRLSFAKIFSRRKSSWAIVRRCLRYPAFISFSRTPTCDRQTDRQTDRHTTTTYTALACRDKDVNHFNFYTLIACLNQNIAESQLKPLGELSKTQWEKKQAFSENIRKKNIKLPKWGAKPSLAQTCDYVAQSKTIGGNCCYKIKSHRD